MIYCVFIAAVSSPDHSSSQWVAWNISLPLPLLQHHHHHHIAFGISHGYHLRLVLLYRRVRDADGPHLRHSLLRCALGLCGYCVNGCGFVVIPAVPSADSLSIGRP